MQDLLFQINCLYLCVQYKMHTIWVTKHFIENDFDTQCYNFVHTLDKSSCEYMLTKVWYMNFNDKQRKVFCCNLKAKFKRMGNIFTSKLFWSYLLWPWMIWTVNKRKHPTINCSTADVKMNIEEIRH